MTFPDPGATGSHTQSEKTFVAKDGAWIEQADSKFIAVNWPNQHFIDLGPIRAHNVIRIDFSVRCSANCNLALRFKSGATYLEGSNFSQKYGINYWGSGGAAVKDLMDWRTAGSPQLFALNSGRSTAMLKANIAHQANIMILNQGGGWLAVKWHFYYASQDGAALLSEGFISYNHHINEIDRLELMADSGANIYMCDFTAEYW